MLAWGLQSHTCSPGSPRPATAGPVRATGRELRLALLSWPSFPITWSSSAKLLEKENSGNQLPLLGSELRP